MYVCFFERNIITQNQKYLLDNCQLSFAFCSQGFFFVYCRQIFLFVYAFKYNRAVCRHRYSFSMVRMNNCEYNQASIIQLSPFIHQVNQIINLNFGCFSLLLLPNLSRLAVIHQCFNMIKIRFVNYLHPLN